MTGGEPGGLEDIDVGELGRAMLDAARAGHVGVTVTFVDGPRPQHAYISDVAAEILGAPKQELLARDPLALIAPTDLPRITDRWSRRHAGETGAASYEVRIRRADGRDGMVQVTAGLATISGRAAVFAFLVDASARHEAQKQRLGYETRFRDLIEMAPELIGIIRDGRFVYANRAYVRALGYASTDDLYATPLSSLVEPEDVEMQRTREDDVRRGKRPPSYVYRAVRKDGTRLMLEVNSVYFEYEGESAVLTMARDVTERKRLEAQLVQADRLAALGTMAAGVAHEINNPLAYVMLNLEWVARRLPSLQGEPETLNGVAAMLEEARQGAERVAAIVRELRSFSRADGETRQLVDLAAVVQAAIKLASNEVRSRAHVVTSFEDAPPVWGNEARLEQVVVNLLLNAAQAMGTRSAEQNEIRVSLRDDAQGRAVLEIHDNGEGIPADVLPRIFDPFFTTKAVGGTGLGLSICHGIVASLGGQISAFSDASEGTTFRVVLPTAENVVADRPPPSRDERRTDGPRARVLVIDDELAIAQTLRELLSPEHDVVASSDPAGAVAMLLADEFDVVFCDLIMPGMDGIAIYERVRAERPGMHRRIVFMTGGAFTARTADFLASVDNRRVEKPFSFAVVERIVREAAGKAR